jgi:putative oxidoreductase
MKIAVIIIRSLIGLLLLFASVSYFFQLTPQPELQGDVKAFMVGVSTIHLFPVIKAVELLCGIAFITGRFVTLANVVIFPVIIGILLFHGTLDPANIASGVFLLLGVLFLAWYHRKNYETLFISKSF